MVNEKHAFAAAIILMLAFVGFIFAGGGRGSAAEHQVDNSLPVNSGNAAPPGGSL